MKRILVPLFIFCATCSVAVRRAKAITIDTVPVGDVGNSDDLTTGNIFGGVNYAYNIGTTEVTVGQYTAFLNAVAATDTYELYNPSMATDLNSAGIAQTGSPGNYSYSLIGSANHPVTWVSWGDAARFSNWLYNGQPGLGGPAVPQNAASTEDGSYTLNGATTRKTLNAVKRNVGATWVIPSEDEWYKAAYYQPAAKGGDSDNYWKYPMRTNSMPYSDQPPGTTPDNTKVGNFYADGDLSNGYNDNDGFAVTGSAIYDENQNYLTDVGAYTFSPSYYGTFDQGGNVFEWNETVISGAERVLRGGSWGHDVNTLMALSRTFYTPTNENNSSGFRVAEVPEPSTAVLAALGVLGLIALRRRHATRCGFATKSSSSKGQLMKQFLLPLCLFCATSLVAVRRVSAITIETVPIGDIGNPNDPSDGDAYETREIEHFGAVPYAYNIGKYEVTIGQYTAFLNAVAATDTYALYNTSMATDLNIAGIARSGVSGSYSYSVIGSANRPIAYISWADAARFCNWLSNGQRGLAGPAVPQNAASTEDGSYTLNYAATTGAWYSVTRNAGATWVIPTENEWYKAAYYQPVAKGGDSDNYWAYPTQTNSVPNSDQPPGDPSIQSNVANFFRDDEMDNGYNDGYALNGSYSHLQNYLTDVGSYTATPNYYGTFDMAGNVWEWNESVLAGPDRGLRGGAWDTHFTNLQAGFRYENPSQGLDFSYIGFRVAQVPEPSTAILAALGLLGLIALKHHHS